MTLTNFAILTSGSTLMHASLAHISQELRTMDLIIQNASNASLPTEILIIIRGWLFPTVTAQLLAQSAAALLAYEKSLRGLLCPDCVAYNLDIYGPDVWHWEQFSGACACLEIVEPGRQAHDHGSRGDHLKPSFDIINPKQFYDSFQWLEHHLSNQITLPVYTTIKHHSYHHSAMVKTARLTSIWDVVDNVLREFDCKVNHESDDVRAYNPGHSKPKRDTVQIIPLQRNLDSTGADETDANWHAYTLLRRASRDLGLLLEYPQSFDASRSVASPFRRRSRWMNSSDTTYIYHHPKDLIPQVFCFITTFAAAFLSLPVTFATLTLTILCFYSHPRSLRIL